MGADTERDRRARSVGHNVMSSLKVPLSVWDLDPLQLIHGSLAPKSADDLALNALLAMRPKSDDVMHISRQESKLDCANYYRTLSVR